MEYITFFLRIIYLNIFKKIVENFFYSAGTFSPPPGIGSRFLIKMFLLFLGGAESARTFSLTIFGLHLLNYYSCSVEILYRDCSSIPLEFQK